jgi:hypothetical protein
MNQTDLKAKMTEKVSERYRTDVLGERSSRTLEEALQECLDNTTPEHPGTPNYDDGSGEDQDDNAGWI